MKKQIFLLLLLSFTLSIKVMAQETNPPPTYDAGQEEDKDLAIEKEVKKKPVPKKEETPAAPPTQEIKEKIQVTSEKPVELPAQPQPKAEAKTVEPPKAPEPPKVLPPIPEAPKTPEIPVPSNTAVIQVSPMEETKASQDGGPFKDAGNDLATSLSITYSLYDDNSLSSQDRMDIFKFYIRTKEGVGVILKPNNPAMQIACEILSETGELLSQTQAATAGAPLSFQTSPFDKNGVIYLRITDMTLLPETPPTDIRRYSLEFKPIAAVVETAPPVQAEAAKAAPEKKNETPKTEAVTGNWFLYGLIGIVVLGAVLLVMILIRKRRQQ